jgi:hypothetical protein
MQQFPAYRRARDLAGGVFPVSETVILRTARKHGIGRKMGRSIIFSPEERPVPESLRARTRQTRPSSETSPSRPGSWCRGPADVGIGQSAGRAGEEADEIL